MILQLSCVLTAYLALIGATATSGTRADGQPAVRLEVSESVLCALPESVSVGLYPTVYTDPTQSRYAYIPVRAERSGWSSMALRGQSTNRSAMTGSTIEVP